MYRQLNGPATYGALSVTTTPVEVKVGATPFLGRIAVTIQPLNGTVYYGYDNSVSSSTGTRIFNKQTLFLECGEKLPIFVVAGGGTVDVRITEVQ